MKEIFIIKNHYKNDSHQDIKEKDIEAQKYHKKQKYKKNQKYNKNQKYTEKPIKQKHSLAGNYYNKICSRKCYLINKLKEWSYCECIKREREKQIKENRDLKLIFIP